MKLVRSVLGRAASVLLLTAAAAACTDAQPTAAPTPPDEARAPSFNVRGRSPRDVPEVRIDLPAKARAWDRDPAALAAAVAEGDGHAVVAFKEPGSARALKTGRRGAVTAGTVRAGIQLLERHGAEILDLLDGIGGARVRISPAAAAEIARHPLVDFVEPRQYGRVQAQSTPAGVTLVQAPDFWTATSGIAGAGVKVEIIDTGWQPGHPDLPAVPAANCSGFFGGCDDTAGANWHGTHVMGIIAARNNADGVVGVAHGLGASDVYVYGACSSATGSCPTDQVTAGINAGIWNVDVMNLSLVQPFDLAQSTAVGQAWNNGIVLVAAAGNNLTSTLTYPANYANVLGVSGVKADESFATTSSCGNYSNQGSHVDLAAPFEAYSIMGTNSYGTQCGTSMAAAHVSGLAALVRSKNPAWTNRQVVDSLQAWAEDLGSAGRDNLYGHGLARPHRVTPVSTSVSGPTPITSRATYTWTANPGGGNGAYTYLWEYRARGGTAWSVVGTGKTYLRTVSLATSFDLRATVTSGGPSATDTILVDVALPPAPTASISGTASTAAAGTFTWSANAAGGNGAYAYAWEHRPVGGAWTQVGTGSTYTRTVAAGAPAYELRVTVTSAGLTGSDTHLVYSGLPTVPTANITGTTAVTRRTTYTWSADPGGGDGTYTYAWEYRPQGGAWSQVGTGSTYSRTVIVGAPAFELRVTVTSAGQADSDTHLVSVDIPPPLSATVTGPGSLSPGAAGTWQANASGGAGTYTYQWHYRNTTGDTWSHGGSESQLSRVAPSQSFHLFVVVTSGTESVLSPSFLVTVP